MSDKPARRRLPVTRYVGATSPRRPPLEGEILRPEKYLEVGLTPDGREVIVNVPMPYDEIEETIRLHGHHVIFSADQARSLARLLNRKADECTQ